MDSDGEERLRNIVRLGTSKLMKYGPSEQIDLEAMNMRFVAENTTMPVPSIHNVEAHNNGVKSILMKFIDGRTLEDAWSDMLPSQKISVAQELREFVLQLRDIKSDSTFKGSENNRSDTRSIGLMANRERRILFNERQSTTATMFIPNLLQHYLPAKREERLVFTHGDLAPRNIIVDDHGHVAAILDWEYAGWYPEWWEAAKAYESCNDIPGWAAFLSIILPPDHAAEYMTLAYARHFAR